MSPSKETVCIKFRNGTFYPRPPPQFRHRMPAIAMSTNHAAKKCRETQYSQPENEHEFALHTLRSHKRAHLVLLVPDTSPDGEESWKPGWEGWPRRRPGSGQCIDHVREGGAIGWKPASFGCIVVDVDYGDPAELAKVHPPLAFLKTRRGAHLVYRAGDLDVMDNSTFHWLDLSGEIKSTGMCRFHGHGAETLALALTAPDANKKTFPAELLLPRECKAAKKKQARTVHGSPPKWGKTRQPKLVIVPRIDEVQEGNRNVSLFEIGRHATYQFGYNDYADLEGQCIAHAHAIVNSFECRPEPVPKVEATGRSWARYRWKHDTGQKPPSLLRQPSTAIKKIAPPSPCPVLSPGGMIKAHGTGSALDPAQRRRCSQGGKRRAERVRAKNYKRDCRIWRLHDADTSIREIEPHVDIKRNAIHTVVQRKPSGQGELDKRLRHLAKFELRMFGRGRTKPHLTRIANKLGLRSTVVKAWLSLPPGPDYINDHTAKLAARAARKPRDKTVTKIRRTLAEYRKRTAAELKTEFPEVALLVIEEQISRQRRIEAKSRWWWERRQGGNTGRGDPPPSSQKWIDFGHGNANR